jgi:NADH:ubiquinone oxidoreductase subunit H
VFRFYNQETMRQSVWPAGINDATFFTAMLLLSSVHLDGMHFVPFSPVTTALKLDAMRLVRENLQRASPDAAIYCISAIASLATSALVRAPTTYH